MADLPMSNTVAPLLQPHLMALRKELRMHAPTIETVFYAMQKNAQELPLYIKRWKGIVDHVKYGHDISSSFSINKKSADDHLPVRQKTCMNIWERMTIHWNGDVSLCNEDIDGDYIVANLARQTIKEAWNTDKLKAYRNLHKEKRFQEIPLCKNCDMFSP